MANRNAVIGRMLTQMPNIPCVKEVLPTSMLMFKKSGPIFIVYFLNKNGQGFLNLLYDQEVLINFVWYTLNPKIYIVLYVREVLSNFLCKLTV